MIAMAQTHTVSFNWASPGSSLAYSKAYTATNETNIVGETIADNATDYEIVVAIDVSAVKSFYVVSDQAITIETNNGTTPDDTLNLAAGIPYVWTTDMLDSFLLGTDVTSIFVTNASGATATLHLRCLQDATP
jgi:hypothetical protein